MTTQKIRLLVGFEKGSLEKFRVIKVFTPNPSARYDRSGRKAKTRKPDTRGTSVKTRKSLRNGAGGSRAS